MLAALRYTRPSLCKSNRTRRPTDIDRTADMYKIYLYEHDVVHDELALPRPKSSIIEKHHTTEKILIRKIDLRLLPILGALYAISLMDRVNVRWLPTKKNLSH